MTGRRVVSKANDPLGWAPVAAGNRAGDGMARAICVGTTRWPASKYKSFYNFLKFVLDKAQTFGYNRARSGGERRVNLSDHGPVAQLVRAPACHAGGRRFEPDPGRHLLL